MTMYREIEKNTNKYYFEYLKKSLRQKQKHSTLYIFQVIFFLKYVTVGLIDQLLRPYEGGQSEDLCSLCGPLSFDLMLLIWKMKIINL